MKNFVAEIHSSQTENDKHEATVEVSCANTKGMDRGCAHWEHCCTESDTGMAREHSRRQTLLWSLTHIKITLANYQNFSIRKHP